MHYHFQGYPPQEMFYLLRCDVNCNQSAIQDEETNLDPDLPQI